MSESTDPAPALIECPPPAERVAAAPAGDPRGELLRMAGELARTRSARLLGDYLRLRRLTAAGRA